MTRGHRFLRAGEHDQHVDLQWNRPWGATSTHRTSQTGQDGLSPHLAHRAPKEAVGLPVTYGEKKRSSRFCAVSPNVRTFADENSRKVFPIAVNAMEGRWVWIYKKCVWISWAERPRGVCKSSHDFVCTGSWLPSTRIRTRSNQVTSSLEIVVRESTYQNVRNLGLNLVFLRLVVEHLKSSIFPQACVTSYLSNVVWNSGIFKRLISVSIFASLIGKKFHKMISLSFSLLTNEKF